MKKLAYLVLSALAILLLNCKGSNAYRGAWKAMDAKGARMEIVFDENTIAVKDSAGAVSTLHYTQNSVNFHNSERTYGISVKEGGMYQLYFPKGETSGLIRIDENNVLYSIDRAQYIPFEDRFGWTK
jgi:hypothetical protein